MKMFEELESCYSAVASNEVCSEADFGDALNRLEDLGVKVKAALGDVREVKTQLLIYGCSDSAVQFAESAELLLEEVLKEF